MIPFSIKTEDRRSRLGSCKMEWIERCMRDGRGIVGAQKRDVTGLPHGVDKRDYVPDRRGSFAANRNIYRVRALGFSGSTTKKAGFKVYSQLSRVAIFCFERGWLACLGRLQEKSSFLVAWLGRLPHLKKR